MFTIERLLSPILAMIRKQQSNNEMESYILNALSGGVLDKKAVKQVEAML